MTGPVGRCTIDCRTVDRLIRISVNRPIRAGRLASIGLNSTVLNSAVLASIGRVRAVGLGQARSADERVVSGSFAAPARMRASGLSHFVHRELLGCSW
jgi:hypothetical protein